MSYDEPKILSSQLNQFCLMGADVGQVAQQRFLHMQPLSDTADVPHLQDRRDEEETYGPGRNGRPAGSRFDTSTEHVSMQCLRAFWAQIGVSKRSDWTLLQQSSFTGLRPLEKRRHTD